MLPFTTLPSSIPLKPDYLLPAPVPLRYFCVN
jgi:hypothetical protein